METQATLNMSLTSNLQSFLTDEEAFDSVDGGNSTFERQDSFNANCHTLLIVRRRQIRSRTSSLSKSQSSQPLFEQEYDGWRGRRAKLTSQEMVQYYKLYNL